jgi:hypothetical protein
VMTGYAGGISQANAAEARLWGPAKSRAPAQGCPRVQRPIGRGDIRAELAASAMLHRTVQ